MVKNKKIALDNGKCQLVLYPKPPYRVVGLVELSCPAELF